MVIEVSPELLKSYGPTVAVLYGYIKAKSKTGSLIGGVKCSPIHINEFCDALGGLHRNTVFKHLTTLSNHDYIVTSSKKIVNSKGESGINPEIRTPQGIVFFGISKEV